MRSQLQFALFVGTFSCLWKKYFFDKNLDWILMDWPSGGCFPTPDDCLQASWQGPFFFQNNTSLELLTPFLWFSDLLNSKKTRNLTRSRVDQFSARDVWYGPIWWQKGSLYQVPRIRYPWIYQWIYPWIYPWIFLWRATVQQLVLPPK